MSIQEMHVLNPDYSVACCNNLLEIPDYSANHIEDTHQKKKKTHFCHTFALTVRALMMISQK